MTQTPSPESFLLKWRGDCVEVTLTLDSPRAGRAALRTNIGRADVRRDEIIDETEKGLTPMARAWTDLPLPEVRPGVFSAVIPLDQVGVFSGKACFFPKGSNVPEWPEGRNFHIKVMSAETRANNSIYCVFPRQFGSFREVARRLPLIMDKMGFGIIQTLPPFPVPTTYAVMGEYGCPFAATDFLSVDPAMAEFDEFATPLMQFKELIGAVHAKGGRLLVDLPANHTGWASTLQTHHPEWFRHEPDGRFHSPGAWGVKWADLVELDYTNAELRAYMAEVFLFWVRIGVDGFRCDAGYMIPAETWEYIVAKVREEYPDTIFFLEGLGGKLETTDRLLAESNLDWAYSELFQTPDRNAFEWYFPGAAIRAEKYGALVHFAETHDNDRLAKRGHTYACLRVQLAALLSWQGAWGIANGVEWFATEKIDVHGKNDLNWGASENMVELIADLNRRLKTHPSFTGACRIELITRGGGNTLAALRTASNGSKALVLANLDCERGIEIDWDRSRFAHFGPVHLGPGEVRWMEADAKDSSEVAKVESVRVERPVPLFHAVLPRDTNRDLIVPEGEWIEFTSTCPFRVRLIDTDTGRTVRVFRSDADNTVLFDAPHYHGDGTRSRLLSMDVTRYVDGKALCTHSRFLVPPPPDMARVDFVLPGEVVRAHPEWRTILSSPTGAAAQLRIGWGEIRSQYDAFLAANPNPTCPSDRLNLWTRTRIWLQREGYTRELNYKCVTKFIADPAGKVAAWTFNVPCGMGKETSFEIRLILADVGSTAMLGVRRLDAGENDVGDQVRLVFRPDLEWRSFHATTKAYQGDIEHRFAAAAKPLPEGEGVVFSPFDGSFTLLAVDCTYHHETEWCYNVSHEEEMYRGQEGAGDVFSPGWISADLKIGDVCGIAGHYSPEKEPDSCGHSADRPEWLKFMELRTPRSFVNSIREAILLYIVNRDELKTVIAGFPWFLDWGRDTFIFMRGMIAAGMYADSLSILKAFAAFEENGTLPNIIYGKTAGNRDTTDAQLWFVRCVEELDAKGEDVTELRKTCKSIVDNYLKGTPNGIRVDGESGLVWSPSHFTWMDTNYPACTPRIGYPIEIQALWISALRFVGRTELADKALASVIRYFKSPKGGYADCLDAPNGESAAKARPDFAVRPNQLFLVTLGILEDETILTSTEELLVPGGIRSLSSSDSRYRGVYAGDEDTSRKPAYHNGTVWCWQFPLYAEALAILRPQAGHVALSLLSSSVDALNGGTIGHISENMDGDAPHAQKGCTAQAWSDSELLRVWLKLTGK